MSATLALLITPAFGSEPLLAPGDPVLAIDTDRFVSKSFYPRNESPASALDNDPGTKYLNFGKGNSGFIVTPASVAIVQSFTITTANDREERDPASWEIWGTNDAITSRDNSTGMAENWTLVDSGLMGLPADRHTVGPVVPVSNARSYSSYKMMFPELKDASVTNSMQIADVAFYESTDGVGADVLSPWDPIMAIQSGPDSRYPVAEGPDKSIDGSLGKYVNFGAESSGLIVTPSLGSSLLEKLRITTANDSEARDPTSYEIYGTNDVISSSDNSTGDAENWNLIASGVLNLPSDRNTLGPRVSVSGSTYYDSYKIVFPTLKDQAAANSMQIAEIVLYGIVATIPSLCQGDVDNNGMIMVNDLGLVVALLRQAGPPYRIAEGTALWNPSADMDGNGFIMVSDLGLLVASLRQAGPPYRISCP